MPESAHVSPGFRELLDENRALREQLGSLREQLSWLVGRYERDGIVPVEKIDALIQGGTP